MKPDWPIIRADHETVDVTPADLEVVCSPSTLHNLSAAVRYELAEVLAHLKTRRHLPSHGTPRTPMARKERP